MKTLHSLLAALTLGGSLTAAEVEPGFVSLFNGRDLSGWEGNTSLWSVRDGAITGITPPGREDPQKSPLTHNTFLVWTGGEVADFELRLQYRIAGGNSGIQYRSRLLPPGQFGPIVAGYQADLEAGPTYSGILYEERGRGILARRGEKTVIKPGAAGKPRIEVNGSLGDSGDIQKNIKAGDWNDYVVIARGNRLQHFINGRPTVDVTDEDAAHAARSGILALQLHAGPPMTVQFRHLRLRPLPSTLTDLDRMQGEWKITELMGNGQAADPETISRMSLRVQGNTYELITAEGGDRGTFTLRESAQPREVDATNQNGTRLPGIYEFKDGKLRVCYAFNEAPRPADFTTSEDSNRIYILFERK
jgi:uncharacterized protein (TIGR03067 family)